MVKKKTGIGMNGNVRKIQALFGGKIYKTAVMQKKNQE